MITLLEGMTDGQIWEEYSRVLNTGGGLQEKSMNPLGLES